MRKGTGWFEDDGSAVGVDDEDGEDEGEAGRGGTVEAEGEGRAETADQEDDSDEGAVGVGDVGGDGPC